MINDGASFYVKTDYQWRNQPKAKPERQDNGKPRLWTRDFVFISIINLVVLTGGNMLVSAFPLYLVSLGGDSVTVGVAAAVYAVCSFCMRPITGWILDNKSRRGIFLAAMVGVILIPPLYLLITPLALIICLRGLHGLCWSSSSTSVNTNCCDTLPQERFGEGMSFFGLTNGLAMIIGPALGLAVWEKFGMVPLFLGISGCGVCAMILLSCIKFKKIEKRRRGGGPRSLSQRIVSLFDKRALPASLLMCCLCFPGGAISSFIALFCQDTGVGNGGVYFTFQACGATVVRLFAGKAYDKHGEGPLLLLGCLFFLSGLLSVVFAQSSLLFYIGAFLYGLGYGVTVPAMQTMSLRTVPPERRGAASSTYLVSYDVSFGLGGLLGGVLAKLLGYRPMYCIMALGIVACFVVYMKWGRKQPAAWKVWKASQLEPAK